MRRALAPARFLQWTRLDWLLQKVGFFRILPRSLRQAHAMLPRLKPHYGRLPEVLPAEGKRRARVALFTGCAADAFFPETNLATARVLQRNGCEVWIPPGQGCCGALHYHSAREEPARAFAEANCQAFFPVGCVESARKSGNSSFTLPADSTHPTLDAIIVNAAGCGAMLKDYGHLLHRSPQAEQAERFASKVKDITEFLMELGPIKPEHPVKLRAVYHDACHLCHGQQIRKQPRQLLEMIPGLELLPLAETEICCGAAGSYNLTQPDMAERLGLRKVQNILATGAEAVFTGNVGCILQIGRYLRQNGSQLPVAHPIDALWASYSQKSL
jgi:glycolate oxidase iron-sulfur subunit